MFELDVFVSHPLQLLYDLAAKAFDPLATGYDLIVGHVRLRSIKAFRSPFFPVFLSVVSGHKDVSFLAKRFDSSEMTFMQSPALRLALLPQPFNARFDAGRQSKGECWAGLDSTDVVAMRAWVAPLRVANSPICHRSIQGHFDSSLINLPLW